MVLCLNIEYLPRFCLAEYFYILLENSTVFYSTYIFFCLSFIYLFVIYKCSCLVLCYIFQNCKTEKVTSINYDLCLWKSHENHKKWSVTLYREKCLQHIKFKNTRLQNDMVAILRSDMHIQNKRAAKNLGNKKFLLTKKHVTYTNPSWSYLLPMISVNFIVYILSFFFVFLCVWMCL